MSEYCVCGCPKHKSFCVYCGCPEYIPEDIGLDELEWDDRYQYDYEDDEEDDRSLD